MPVFDYEWMDDAPPYPDPAAHRTMAKLTVRVGDTVATEVYDRYLKESRDHVFVPLSQVAEWAVLHWWRLLHEPAQASGRQRPGFEARHDLSHGGFGFALPRVSLRPLGDLVRAVTTRSNPRGAALEFRGHGDALLRRDDLEAELGSLVEAVLARLRETGSSFTDLEADWRAIHSGDADDRDFCRAAAIAGLDPYDISDAAADSLVRFWNEVPESMRRDALGSAAADGLDALRRWLLEQTETLAEATSGEDWAGIRRRMRRGEAREAPWERGYAAARALRNELDAPPGPFVLHDDGSLAIHSRTVTTPAPGPGILGCVAADSPSCAIVRRGHEARRFLVARSLGDYLGRDEPGHGVLGKLDSPRQAHSRAFAAELLAPEAWLRATVGGARQVDPAAAARLATELQVSPWVIQHQIHNHGIAEVPELRPAAA